MNRNIIDLTLSKMLNKFYAFRVGYINSGFASFYSKLSVLSKWLVDV
jgi:hypothetical protein